MDFLSKRIKEIFNAQDDSIRRQIEAAVGSYHLPFTVLFSLNAVASTSLIRLVELTSSDR